MNTYIIVKNEEEIDEDIGKQFKVGYKQMLWGSCGINGDVYAGTVWCKWS